MNVVALREIYYAGKTHYPGDTMDMPDQDARLLVAVGHVRAEDPPPKATPAPKPAPAPAPNPAPAKPLETQALKAEPSTAHAGGHSKKRQYKRRDMRAED